MAWRIMLKKDHLSGETFDPLKESVFMYDSVEDRIADKHIDFPFSRAFKAYDDDGILYFSGRLEWDSGSGGPANIDGPSEETLFEVYSHFAHSYGAVSVRYHNRPGWLIG